MGEARRASRGRRTRIAASVGPPDRNCSSVKRSTDKILTTHTGSLPRPSDLRALVRRSQVPALSTAEREALQVGIRSAVDDSVRRQLEVGLDVIDDGEA